MNTEGEDTAPTTAGLTPRFGDELLRPFVVAAISVITVVELLERAPLRFAVLIWALTAAMIAVGAASAFPWRRLRDSAGDPVPAGRQQQRPLRGRG
ncbi:hypothetical protein ORV05_12740 [Amycolatopsis cynarae]|uniref:Uncharacterized protein n=1 Tax=Amycolatopsis cynarae TaxID=2995223 RepID=A0ABY7BA93_9PSEU|nr:hypothetical protein [Amycolatopsis sp. HUAS 11-8]WAL68598.1 hypothetical protein ORV05_12740 [Amycolatopsis sp. HUAS 11-8]